MSIDIGIIGLAQSGKTTVFNALTKSKTTTSATRVGIAKVPDPRLKGLADLLHPKRVVPAEARYIDIGASGKGLDRGIAGQLLNELSNTDALINVVRAFADERVPHIKGSLDIDRDITALNLELTFSDLVIMERRLERLEDSLKGAKPQERQTFLKEKELLLRIKSELEKEIPIREQKLTADEVRTITSYQFLTAKPLLIIVNIGEDQLAQATSLETELDSKYGRPKCRVISLCGKLEMELAQLDDSAAENFRTEFGISQAGFERTIKASYELLSLISFFTIASGEVRAWPVPEGTAAVNAAGKIHSDMEKGFIRAEVIGFEDLLRCGSLAEARKRGLLRLEGKSYPVKDGDVITFLFNV